MVRGLALGAVGLGDRYAGAGMNMISGGDATRSARTDAGARGELSGHGGVSGAPTQPVSLLVGTSAGGAGVKVRVLGPVEAVVDDRLVDLGPLRQGRLGHHRCGPASRKGEGCVTATQCLKQLAQKI